MWQHNLKKWGTAAIALMMLGGGLAQAYAPESDLMEIKGYSPGLIEAINTQRSRQEWREPEAPKRTTVEQFFHNVYYNNWTGSVDPFGSGVIRNNP